MSKYLIKETRQYRCDTESEAKQFIEDEKKKAVGEVTKYSSEYREQKVRGEVVDSWYRIQISTTYNSEKEPSDPYVASNHDVIDVIDVIDVSTAPTTSEEVPF